MKKSRLTIKPAYWLAATVIVGIVFAGVMMAQVAPSTVKHRDLETKEVQVERGEVVYVSGNELVVKTESGELKSFTVPDSARANVDGKELSVHDLKPGMKLQRTIVTTTTPAMVTSVRIIQGKVFQVNPPLYVILTLPDNTNKGYKIPEDQKFMIEGQQLTAFELKKGMNVTATVLTQVPETHVTQQRKVTGTGGAPATPPLQGALLIEDPSTTKKMAAATAPAASTSAPAAQASASEPAPKKLPKTGSVVPLVGLLGLFSLLLSFGVRMLRRS